MATISKVITFIPTIGGNNAKDEHERFEVKLRAVQVQKKQAQLRKFIETDPKELMKQMMDQRQQGEIRELLKEHFLKFVNFEVNDLVDEKLVGKEVRFVGENAPRAVTKEDVADFKEYKRPGTMDDVFDLGEFELAMEIFMHMIGNSQLRRTVPNEAGTGGGEQQQLLSLGVEKEDEAKNSVSPSGTTQTPNVH